MIAVIADDLTGAAEMGGLGRRHGLAVEILHRDEPPSYAALLIYDSDSRNCSAPEARRRVRKILQRLLPHRPDWIFKKVDSVLRGNVLAEIETALNTLGLTRGILAPANPAAGRVIRNGQYFIHDRLIHETDFRNDPRHPRLSAQVLDLIGRSPRLAPTIVSLAAPLPDHGLIVGEAATAEDVRAWAARVDGKTLAAGGAEFFRSLLLKHGHAPFLDNPVPSLSSGARTLFVCGSLSESATRFLDQSRTKGWPVLLMPHALFSAGRPAKRFQRAWAEQTISTLHKHRKVVIGIGPPLLAGPRSAQRLGSLLTETARQVLAGTQPDYACVDGGATAALLAEKLGCQRLRIGQEFATGVVGMTSPEHPGLVLVMKPGSYAWSPDLAV